MIHRATNHLPPRVEALIAAHTPGYSLPRGFYCDEEVYRSDVEHIWRKSWLFVGHTCQIPDAGDFFTFQLDTDSVIVTRAADGEVHALHNVCRHRGTLICRETSGNALRLVCPYHQWVYANDGKLLSCRGMHAWIDKSRLGLHKAHVRLLEGLIYVCLAEEAADFDAAYEQMAPLARPQGFENAKVAKMIDYDVRANWKLVWENNRECYHCNVNHPQYTKANFDHFNADDTTDKIREVIDAEVRRSEKKRAAAGLSVTHKQSGMATFPDAERNLWYSANRTALAMNYVSETMDGRQVAPLMGDYTDSDVGTVRLRTVPNFWNHSSCDHGVSTRLVPAGPAHTAVRVIWTVHKDAVEGRDYQLEELLPFWQLTSEQDWVLCEHAQRGVSSSAYTPGPYSKYKEYNVDSFVRWYLGRLSGSAGSERIRRV